VIIHIQGATRGRSAATTLSPTLHENHGIRCSHCLRSIHEEQAANLHTQRYPTGLATPSTCGLPSNLDPVSSANTPSSFTRLSGTSSEQCRFRFPLTWNAAKNALQGHAAIHPTLPSHPTVRWNPGQTVQHPDSTVAPPTYTEALSPTLHLRTPTPTPQVPRIPEGNRDYVAMSSGLPSIANLCWDVSLKKGYLRMSYLTRVLAVSVKFPRLFLFQPSLLEGGRYPTSYRGPAHAAFYRLKKPNPIVCKGICAVRGGESSRVS